MTRRPPRAESRDSASGPIRGSIRGSIRRAVDLGWRRLRPRRPQLAIRTRLTLTFTVLFALGGEIGRAHV